MDFKKCAFLCLLFLFGIHENKGCVEVERLALLEIKAFVESEGYDGDHLLPSWKDDDGTDCCEWERVVCHSNTGRVSELSLNNIRWLPDETFKEYRFQQSSWMFNISMFEDFNELLLLNLSYNLLSWNHNQGSRNLLTLKKLETLDLYWNYFDEKIMASLKGLPSLKNLNLGRNGVGPISVEDLSSFEHLESLNLRYCLLEDIKITKGFDGSFKLSKLKHLDLSHNYISENIFLFLVKLFSLEYLDLSFNFISGPLPVHEISGLSKLKVLLLGGNYINGTLSIQNHTVLQKLQVLDLDTNSLESISLELGALTSLKALSLSVNQLDDSAIKALCGLKMLEELDLSAQIEARFTVIPQCLHNLTSLKLLDLSRNEVVGQVPSSWISRLSSLEYIDIRGYQFQGLFSFSMLHNHSRLEVVGIGSSGDGLRVETENTDWIPKFQLKVLSLPGYNLNMFNHRVPSFLLQQHNLRTIDLSDNNLQGRFPGWLLVNNSKMRQIILRNNSFTGDFYMSLSPMTDLISVDLSENQFQGMLPENLGKIFPNLEQLQLSNNAFGGNIPYSVGLMTNLEALDLSSNSFKGEIPETLFNCTTLRILKLSNNEFSGNFFSHRYNWSGLEFLQLNDNKFSGSMSNVQMNSYMLSYVDISYNFMSGRVPMWIANMSKFDCVLYLQNNNLEGEIPCEMFAPLGYVDLSRNNLSGTIPSCSNMGALSEINLQSNNFTGTIPEALLNSSSLLVLNLGDNRLSGNIPHMISHLSNLKVLLLGKNQLSGIIPDKLCLLKNISLMDLSYNYLSGTIPSCLSYISFGGIVDESSFFAEWFINYSGGADPETVETFGLLKKYLDGYIGSDYERDVQVEFVTKNKNAIYKGIMNFMSGLDLSCNNLVGKIPPEIGKLSEMHSINLSHNHFTGSIPSSFAHLTQIESLDLSHNDLTGEIPFQLTQLTFLEVFSVAYNNLSGRVPYGKAQFSTFDGSSYEGNPLLCGRPLKENCSGDNDPTSSPKPFFLNEDDGGHWYDIDHVMFIASFSASFFIFFVGVVVFLYANLYWRQCLFYYGEKFALSCNYTVSDTLFKLSLHFRIHFCKRM